MNLFGRHRCVVHRFDEDHSVSSSYVNTQYIMTFLLLLSMTKVIPPTAQRNSQRKFLGNLMTKAIAITMILLGPVLCRFISIFYENKKNRAICWISMSGVIVMNISHTYISLWTPNFTESPYVWKLVLRGSTHCPKLGHFRCICVVYM